MSLISASKDVLQIVRRMTFVRLINALQTAFSFYLSRLFRTPVLVPKFPVAISYEPTTHCNLRCPECPSGLRQFSRPIGIADLGLFEKTLEEVKRHTFYLTLYFQGEPLLHPSFTDMVRMANERKFYTATSTNAHHLTKEKATEVVESGLSRLIISVDGTNQQTYEKYRVGGQLDKVLDGVKNMVEAKRTMKSSIPFVAIQFIAFNHNQHQIAEIKKLGNNMGVDAVWIKSAQIYDYKSGSPRIPEDQSLSRYKPNDGQYEIKHKLYNHCWRMWHSMVLTWDGRVVPCCFDKDAQHMLGSVQESNLEQVWGNGAYQGFRKSILTSRKKIDICQNCSEGTSVWL